MINPINYSELTPELARAGCFVLDMPSDAYHAYDGISKSGLDLVDVSPAHYAYAEPRKSTRAMEIGTAIHTAILEPKVFRAEYMLLKDVHDRRASEYKQAVKALGSGERVLTGVEADRVKGMMIGADSNLEFRELCAIQSNYYAEISAFIECPKTGVLLRARYDLLTKRGSAVDLKKTQDARYEAFQKSVANYRYHVQDAFYSHIYKLITGEPLRGFWFLAIEENAPNTAKMYKLDDEARAIGTRQFMANLEAYAEAESTGDWVTYDTTSELMSLPAWALDEEDDGVVL